MAEIMPQLQPRVADLRGNSNHYKAMGARGEKQKYGKVAR